MNKVKAVFFIVLFVVFCAVMIAIYTPDDVSDDEVIIESDTVLLDDVNEIEVYGINTNTSIELVVTSIDGSVSIYYLEHFSPVYDSFEFLLDVFRRSLE